MSGKDWEADESRRIWSALCAVGRSAADSKICTSPLSLSHERVSVLPTKNHVRSKTSKLRPYRPSRILQTRHVLFHTSQAMLVKHRSESASPNNEPIWDFGPAPTHTELLPPLEPCSAHTGRSDSLSSFLKPTPGIAVPAGGNGNVEARLVRERESMRCRERALHAASFGL